MTIIIIISYIIVGYLVEHWSVYDPKMYLNKKLKKIIWRLD